MSNGLRPCECGCEMIAERHVAVGGLLYSYMCISCQKETPLFSSKEAAAEAWNKGVVMIEKEGK